MELKSEKDSCAQFRIKFRGQEVGAQAEKVLDEKMAPEFGSHSKPGQSTPATWDWGRRPFG